MSELNRISQESVYEAVDIDDALRDAPIQPEFDDPEVVGIDETEVEAAMREQIPDIEDKASSTSLALFLNEATKYRVLTAAEEVFYAKQKDVYVESKNRLVPDKDQPDREAIFWEAINNLPPEEQAVKQAIIRGKESYDHIINSNLRLVVSIVKHYRNNGLSFMDLIQEGTIGLHRAVDKFDWSKGFKFSTYATWWIRQSAQRAVANQGNVVRIPVHIQERQTKIRRVERDYEAEHGRIPSDDEIFKATGITPEQIETARSAQKFFNVSSLDKPIDEDEKSFGVFVADSEAQEPPQEAEMSDRSRLIQDAIRVLPENERIVLELRFGFANGENTTLEDIGKVLGITRERVRQIEKQALNRLAGREDIKNIKN